MAPVTRPVPRQVILAVRQQALRALAPGPAPASCGGGLCAIRVAHCLRLYVSAFPEYVTEARLDPARFAEGLSAWAARPDGHALRLQALLLVAALPAQVRPAQPRPGPAGRRVRGPGRERDMDTDGG